MNATKFMDENKKIIFESRISRGFVIISINDNGIGIAKETIPQLFDEFFKADPARHRQGSGLGLAICKRVMDRHGGKIWAESPGLGKGSTFYLTLPIARQQSSLKSNKKAIK
jgi:signal transduction histidine kinase